MPLTSPDSIDYPATSYTGTFTAALSALATSIQAAFTNRGQYRYRWADSTARGAQTGMRADDKGYQIDTDITYRYSGSAWAPWEKGDTSWSPTLQNFNSLGTGGVATGFYSISGGYLDWWIKVNFGTGVAAPSASWGFTLPVALRVALDDWNQRIGDGVLRDSSVASSSAAGNADLAVIFDAATGFASFRQPYSGSAGVTDYGYLSASQTGIPTLANGDYLAARGRYPV